MAQPHILLAVGSLRAGSLNRQLAQVIAQELTGTATTEFLSYSNLPFMNQDLEFPPPAPVVQLRKTLSGANGLWIVSPEYNHGIPGVLKNMLDWASRSVAPQQASAVDGMAVTISGAGGASASSCMQDKLLSVLATMRMRVMSSPTTAVSLDAEAFSTSKLPITNELLRRVRRQAKAFVRFLEDSPS